MGLRTHFRDFDKITNGLVGGQLVIIAGRPGVGKSTFAFNIIERIAKEDNFPVGIFSLEMGADLIAQHLLLLHSRVKSSVFRKDFHSKKEHQLLTSGYDRLKQMPIYIDDTPEPSILSIKSRARRWCRMYDLKLIIIDYLQLLQAGDSGFTGARQITNRENEIAFISRSLKLLAKTLNVPIIAISQLNREVDTRQSKKPRLSDLRESGAIEQDADLVLLMSREDYYGESMPNVAVDMNIAKNRTGPQGEFQLTYMKDMFFFDDYSSRTEEESYE